ncbi:MAG: PKD domain-containing protein [Thermoplasmata archaeon]
MKGLQIIMLFAIFVLLSTPLADMLNKSDMCAISNSIPENYYSGGRQTAKPDFTIIELCTDPQVPSEGQNFTIRCVATNVGDWSDTTKLSIHIDGVLITTWVVPLIPGENLTKSYVTNLPAGSYNICAQADFENTTPEKNESNNILCISVNVNALPVPILDVENNEVFTGEEVKFSAMNSYDKDDGISRYFIDFGDLSMTGWIENANVTHVYSGNGIFRASLRVMDNRGAESAPCYLLITVRNRLPQINMSIYPTRVYTGENVTFSCLSSYDPDGRIEKVMWDFGDGSVSLERLVLHSYVDDGNYTVTLTVVDDDGSPNISWAKVQVLNKAPECIFEVEPKSGNTTTLFLFKSKSKDPDGEVIAWNWDFGDGSQGSGARIFHIFPKIGVYNVSLRVIDDDLAWSDYAWLQIDVSKPESQSYTCAQLLFLGMLSITLIIVTLLAGYIGKRYIGKEKDEDEDKIGKKEKREVKPVAAVNIENMVRKGEEPFKIEDVFVIYHDGRLIFRHMRPSGSKVSSHALSGMLTAIRAFAASSFPTEDKLESINYGKKKIFLEGHDKFYIAIVLSGEETRELREAMNTLVNSIWNRFSEELSSWKGSKQDFEGIEDEVNSFILSLENKK